jgi:GcrA cell cycle regulator
MSNPKPLTPEDEAKIRELVAAGMGLDRIGAEIRRAAPTIRAYVRAHDLRRAGRTPVEWPQERVDQLKALFDKGLSYSLIAEEMGLTKGAISGKADRLGWQRQAHARATRRGSGLIRRGRVAGQVRSIAPPVPPPPVDATHARPWLTRAFGECAYPIAGEGADTLSCCAPTLGKTYCLAHAAIMYRPADAKAAQRERVWTFKRFAA